MKTWIQKILFSDVAPLVRLGSRRALGAEDMPPLDRDQTPADVEQDYATLRSDNAMRFVWDAFWAAGSTARRGMFIRIVSVPVVLSGPLLMRQLLANIPLLGSQPSLLWPTILLAVTLSLVVVADGIMVQHFYYYALKIWGRICNGLNMRVFRHALRITRTAQMTTQTGDLVNHMASDSEGMAEASFFIPEISESIVKVLGASILLYMLLGPAALIALATLFLMLPLTRRAAKRFERYDATLWKQRDERVTVMSQILSGIRVIKYFAWERSVTKEVDALRGHEIESYVKLVRAEAMGVMLFLSTSTVVAFVGFGSFVLLGGTLTASLIFPCLLLFMNLEGPIGTLPHFIKNLAHARVAAERLHRFFQLPTHEVDERPESAESVAVGLDIRNLSVVFENASAAGLATSRTNALQNINLGICPGESIALVGSVGAGKSTLLLSILGEIDVERGSYEWTHLQHDQRPRIAYVSQEAYVLNATVRDNILFGCEAELGNQAAERLDEALTVCSLDVDIAQLSAGLETEIGERGVTLSGGQKMRLTLARAVMKRPAVVLLDDPLAAVDVHTEEQLVDRLLCGMWDTTTRIIATHRLAHLHRFDRVVFLHDGRIEAIGSLSDVHASSERFRAFYAEHTAAEELAQSMSLQQTVVRTSNTSNGDGRLVDDEDRMTGSIKSELFFSYLRTLGSADNRNPAWSYTMLILSCLLVVVLPMTQNAWLAWWSDANRSGIFLMEWMRNPLVAVGLYGIIGVAVLLANFGERLVWMLRATMAGRDIHNQTLASVLAAPLRFFDTTPMGRILNRFAHDLAGVDDELSWNFESTFRSLALMIGTLVLVLSTVPIVILAAAPALFVFYRIQRDYRRSAREAKRLSSISRSPRYAHFKETITGLPVIRAFRQQDSFTELFVQKLEYFQRMNWGSILLNRWFSSRAPVLSGVIALATTVTIVVLCSQGKLSAGLAGVVITYSLTFWANLNWCVRSFSEVESRMTSYERLRAYGQILPEPSTTAQPVLSEATPWPTTGSIEFRNVQARYADGLPLVLRDLSFCIDGGSRIGIVGRTGSGKTTIFQTLFRFVELSGGAIEIDGINIARIPTERLRRAMAVIPQDPMLFIGTIRSNLDRYQEYTDSAVWSALHRVQMDKTIRDLGGLDLEVRESGLNFSQGQRQLLCLARAILTQARIIVMDEATASVDVQTDALIQQTIRDEFRLVTVLIIAHRLNSVADADFIVEMHAGKAQIHRSVTEIADDSVA